MRSVKMKPDTKSRIPQFLLWTFAITWICWGTVVIANRFGQLQYGTPIAMTLFLIGGNGAPIASYFLLKRWGEIEGFKSFMKKFFQFKADWKHYVLILGFLALHFLIPLAMGASNQTMALYMGLAYIPVNIIGGGLEEIGWRGILQPELEKKISFVPATVVVALIWAVWHLPLWAIVGTYQSTIGFYMFTVSVFGFSFVLAAIRKVTGSVFLCILFHASINSFMGVFMLDQNISTIFTIVMEIGVSIGVITWWSKRKKKQEFQSNR